MPTDNRNNLFPPVAMNDEKWIPLTGLEDVYSISNHGRIKRNKNDKILSAEINQGYLFTNLCYRGQKYRKRLHRLVAIHFLKNLNAFIHVHHIDGNKLNNHVDNLLCINANDHNNLHKNHHYCPHGSKNPNSKLTESNVKEIKTLLNSGDFSMTKIGEKFNVTYSAIEAIASKKTWAHVTI